MPFSKKTTDKVQTSSSIFRKRFNLSIAVRFAKTTSQSLPCKTVPLHLNVLGLRGFEGAFRLPGQAFKGVRLRVVVLGSWGTALWPGFRRPCRAFFARYPLYARRRARLAPYFLRRLLIMCGATRGC